MNEDDSIKIVVKVNGKTFELYPYLSINDLKIISEKANNAQTSEDYRTIIVELITNHTDGIFSYEEINKLDDSVLQEYLNICMIGDMILKNYYEKQNESDTFKRFVIAAQKTEKIHSKSFMKFSGNIYEHFQKIPNNIGIMTPTLININKTTQEIRNIEKTTKLVQNMDNTTKQIQRLSNAALSGNQTVIDTQKFLTEFSSVNLAWTHGLAKINEAIKSATPDYSMMISDIKSTVQELLNSFQLPEAIANRRQELIESFEKWGELGWTIPPNAGIVLFSNPPSDEKDAYNKIKGFIDDTSMNKLFDKITKMPHVKKLDIEEAMACFREKHYKSCCMILFSIIDAKLIRSQLKTDKKHGQRACGLKAANNLFNRIDDNYNAGSFFYIGLYQDNILSAFCTLFENGNDFKKQPNTINRNFLDHGMLYRRVTRKDCVMVFLLLYNFFDFMNFISGVPNTQ